MSFSVRVVEINDKFVASLLGAPDVKAEEATHTEAMDALRTMIIQLVHAGELVMLDINNVGISGLAGKYADDPTWKDICDEAYRLRDADLAKLEAEWAKSDT